MPQCCGTPVGLRTLRVTQDPHGTRDAYGTWGPPVTLDPHGTWHPHGTWDPHSTWDPRVTQDLYGVWHPHGTWDPCGTRDPHGMQHPYVTWDPLVPETPLRHLGPSWHPGPPMAPTIPMSPGTPAVAGSPVAPGTRGDTWDPSWPPAPLSGPTVAPPWPPAPIAGPSAPDGTWWEGGGGQREFQSQPPPPPFGGVPWLLLHPTALLSCRGGCAAAWGLHPCMGEVVSLHGRGEGLRASTLGGGRIAAWGAAFPSGGCTAACLHGPVVLQPVFVVPRNTRRVLNPPIASEPPRGPPPMALV